MGLLAQEVEATLEKHGLGNSGMVHQPTEDSYMSLRYNDLLAPMIKAIQELDAQHKQEVASFKIGPIPTRRTPRYRSISTGADSPIAKDG